MAVAMYHHVHHRYALLFFCFLYTDVVADDASTALCKMLYNSPSFQLTAQDIKDKFDDATMPKMTDALKMLVDIEKIKVFIVVSCLSATRTVSSCHL